MAKPRLGTVDYSQERRQMLHKAYHTQKNVKSATQISMELNLNPQVFYCCRKAKWWAELDKTMSYVD